MKILSSLAAIVLTSLQITWCQLPVEYPGSPTPKSPPLTNPSFAPDWNSKSFLKDGKAFRYISGEFHYTRVLPEYWQERLQQMKAAGLDAVQTYVFWNVHEPRPGVFDFEGRYNLSRFIDLAQGEGLLVILRVGPYVDAEWDLGGLPSWLLTTPNIMLRSADINWQTFLWKWLDVLLLMVEPRLYRNGGPVILMQFENEYGSFGADWEYVSNLITFFVDALPKETGLNLFSVDGANYTLLKRGTLTGVLATIDFGVEANVAEAVGELRKFMAGNPFVNSEFYTGWSDYWGGEHHTVATDKILSSLAEILNSDGSVSFYMFAGGTNFGFMNGADAEYSPVTTSYDYDAPISEGGELTEKYFAIREFIQVYRNVTLPQPPESRKKLVYGKVPLEYFGSILDQKNLEMYEAHTFTTPVTMEVIEQSFGFIFYRTTFATGSCQQGSPSTVNITIHDRAHFFLNGELVTILNRTSNPVVTFYKNCSISNQKIEVFVENMGRICYQHRDVFTGHSLLDNEVKGILQFNKTDEAIKSWEVYSVPMTSLEHTSLREQFEENSQLSKHLCYYQGVLPVETNSQNGTYLYLEQFSKGQVFINSFNLGRYWSAKGPQKSLYVPGSLFYSDSPNYITLFELDNCTHPADAFVTFLDVPVLG